MRVPTLLLLWVLVLGLSGAGAQDVGNDGRLWRAYLSETVRRGLILTGPADLASSTPYWPSLDRLRSVDRALSPGPDTDLVGVWMDRHEDDQRAALATLQSRWPLLAPGHLPPARWAETLFETWDPTADPKAWTAAWLGWEAKVYHPRSLVRGLSAFEITDRSAVVPLLTQALALYPEDRRFLPLVARHHQVVRNAQDLLARDRERSGLGTSPVVATQGQDYGAWLVSATNAEAAPADGPWSWDAEGDGRAESRLVFQGGKPVTWTRQNGDGGLWTLRFVDGNPSQVTEVRGGATWVLDYERYPWARSLEYRWGAETQTFRFPPLSQEVPLAPAERFQAPPARRPAVLAQFFLPLDPRALAQASATVETRDRDRLVRTVHLARGTVWLTVEDSDRNGFADTWTYFRSGVLDVVYRDLASTGTADLRELYRKGQLAQVQVRAPGKPRAEFVLFPAEGVQLWDPQGDRRPLERRFVWSQTGALAALVFSGAQVPWETMPPWEPRP